MRHKKTQEGMFIALFALATVVIIGILVSYMSNWVNDMIATQTQVFFSKQAYWNTYSGMEIATSKKIASLDGVPNANVSFSTGTITIARTTTADEYLGGNKVSTITSTGSDLRGRSRAIKLEIGDPGPGCNENIEGHISEDICDAGAADHSVNSTGHFSLWNALIFDGSDDYISMGNVLNLGLGHLSISAWFKYSATANEFPQIVNKHGAGQGYGIEIINDGDINDGKVRAYIENVSASRIDALSTATTAKDGNWHHVVATWDRGGNLIVYLDGTAGTGVSISSQSSDDILNSLEFDIGVGNNHTVQFFNGIIDEVAVWNKVLSLAEIQSLYIQGMSFDIGANMGTNLVAYWGFDGDGVDGSGNDLTATVTGAEYTGF